MTGRRIYQDFRTKEEWAKTGHTVKDGEKPIGLRFNTGYPVFARCQVKKNNDRQKLQDGNRKK